MRSDHVRDERSERLKELLRSKPEPPMFEGPLAYVVGGVAICAASFFVTLLLTEPQQVFEGPSVSQRIERLQGARIFNQSALEKEAEAVGLFPSKGLRAVIDYARRGTGGQAEIAGWASNPASDGSPVTLIVFIKGKGVPIGRTEGEREDVTRALRLPARAAKNVTINHTFLCPARNSFLLVAIDEKGGYFALPPRDCP